MGWLGPGVEQDPDREEDRSRACGRVPPSPARHRTPFRCEKGGAFAAPPPRSGCSRPILRSAPSEAPMDLEGICCGGALPPSVPSHTHARQAKRTVRAGSRVSARHRGRRPVFEGFESLAGLPRSAPAGPSNLLTKSSVTPVAPGIGLARSFASFRRRAPRKAARFGCFSRSSTSSGSISPFFAMSKSPLEEAPMRDRARLVLDGRADQGKRRGMVP